MMDAQQKQHTLFLIRQAVENVDRAVHVLNHAVEDARNPMEYDPLIRYAVTIISEACMRLEDAQDSIGKPTQHELPF